MGRSYYYFAASLPLIFFDTKLPFTVESFLEDCQRLLTPGDFTFMQALLSEEKSESPCGGNGFVSAWQDFERCLGNEIAVFRAGKLRKNAQDYVRGSRDSSPKILEIIQQAAAQEDLLKGERMLDQARWMFLDELTAGHAFDFETIAAFGLKLKILERQQLFQTDAGEHKLETIKHFEESSESSTQ